MFAAVAEWERLFAGLNKALHEVTVIARAAYKGRLFCRRDLIAPSFEASEVFLAACGGASLF